ncbi:MAG: DMT family transporter [Holosporales bacterium]|jgi:S-adenosylmethionine uptake transporter|nr:DMT family transporter [Holosporales bacterium]
MQNWFNRPGYLQGIFFSLLVFLVSSTNDTVMKFVGQRLSELEVAFFRFFFGFITLLPFIIKRGRSIFVTKYLGLNILRSVLGFLSVLLCVYSVIKMPLAEVTTVFWTLPLFVLVLSAIFLKERISANRWRATFIGFSGLYFLMSPDGVSLRLVILIPVASAILFAIQDILIKKMIDNEDRFTMLFYFSLGTTALSLIPALCDWARPTGNELIWLFVLGAGGNLIQYFIFKAYAAAELSALAPFRYCEFIVSAAFGFIFFGDVPGMNLYIAAAIIAPSTLYLVYNESSKKRKLSKPA